MVYNRTNSLKLVCPLSFDLDWELSIQGLHELPMLVHHQSPLIVVLLRLGHVNNQTRNPHEILV